MSEPRWSFCVFHDTHLGGSGTGTWNNRILLAEALPLTRALMARLQREGHAFGLLLGDIADRGDRAAFQAMGAALATLPFPVYPVPGNHDAALPESRAWLREALRPPAPQGELIYYDFIHEGLYFALLDAVWQQADGTRTLAYEPAAAGVGMAVPEEALAWLDERLQWHAHYPAFICLHHPLLPLRADKRARGARDAGALLNGAEVLAVLDQHPQVRAVLAGHMHLAQVDERRGVCHATGAAVVEWPHVYRRFDVYGDRVRVITPTVADEATRARSLLPGHEWAAGEPREQAFEIPL